MTRLPNILKIGTTIVSSIILSYLIGFVSDKINVLEKFTIAINDIDFSDLYYQYQQAPKMDTNIVLVNIGYQDREALAGLLKIISDNNPKVIGGDVFFSPENDSLSIEGTKSIANQIQRTSNLVLASSHQITNEGLDFIAGQSPLVKGNAKEGIVSLNVATDDPEYGTVRSFEPITDIRGTKHLSFHFFIGSLWDSTVLNHAYEGEMMIKWYGYGDRNLPSDTNRVFKTFDWYQIQNGEFNKADLENKIVLLGFMGDKIGIYSVTDQFYSPLNKKLIGRSFPDMYGVEIHANIVKMIIDKDFIYHSKIADYIFNLTFLVFLTMTLFWIQRKYERQYSLISKGALIIYTNLLVIGTILIFIWTNGQMKFLIGDGLFVMLFLPDIYEFMETNVFSRIKSGNAPAVNNVHVP